MTRATRQRPHGPAAAGLALGPSAAAGGQRVKILQWATSPCFQWADWLKGSREIGRYAQRLLLGLAFLSCELGAQEAAPTAETRPAGAAAAAPAAAAIAPTASLAKPVSSRQTVQARRLPWPDLVRWMGRISFSSNGSRRALEMLSRGNLGPEDRAAALYALGAGGLGSEVSRLEQAAVFGTPAERLAALFALGELPRVPAEFLASQVARGAGLEANAALFALAIGRERQDQPLLEAALARNPDLAQLTEVWRIALERPGRAQQSPVLEAYFSVRYAAAKRYGYFDRQSFAAVRSAELASDQAFLERLVLPQAAISELPGLGDLLLEHLLKAPSPAAIQALLVAAPKALDDLIGNGLWLPKGPEQLEALCAGLEAQKVSLDNRASVGLLMTQPDFALRAAALALQVDPSGQASGAFEVLDPALRSADEAQRAEACLALGRSGWDGWVSELERLDSDGSLRVRLAAQVARLALGDPRSSAPLEALLEETEGEFFSVALGDLCRLSPRGGIGDLLEELLIDLPADHQLEVALALAGRQDAAARALLRQALENSSAGDLAPAAIRALAKGAASEELELFERLFPDDQDPAINSALCAALIEQDSPTGRRYLRAALWEGDFTLGVLAACALVRGHGLPALYEELNSPPPESRPQDLRRLGFAIGMLGGLSELERLSANRRASDPSLQGAYLGALTNRTR